MFDAGKLRSVGSLDIAGWSLQAAEVGRPLVNVQTYRDDSSGLRAKALHCRVNGPGGRG